MTRIDGFSMVRYRTLGRKQYGRWQRLDLKQVGGRAQIKKSGLPQVPFELTVTLDVAARTLTVSLSENGQPAGQIGLDLNNGGLKVKDRDYYAGVPIIVPFHSGADLHAKPSAGNFVKYLGLLMGYLDAAVEPGTGKLEVLENPTGTDERYTPKLLAWLQDYLTRFFY